MLFRSGWGLARASNTGPHIILRFEARTEERLAEIRELVESKMARIESELGAASEA